VGLRERKAQRTRASIVAIALELFESRGFDGTTMREIAEAAEIGPATLYRYFPSKEALLLDRATRQAGRLAALLDERPDDEPIDLALGLALRAFAVELEPVADEIARVRRLVDAAPRARALVWDTRDLELDALQNAIARRTGASPSDLGVVAAARTTVMLAETVLDLRRSGAGEASMSDDAERLMSAMASGVVPRTRR
jgi:AcrR family transcriptional regulator